MWLRSFTELRRELFRPAFVISKARIYSRNTVLLALATLGTMVGYVIASRLLSSTGIG